MVVPLQVKDIVFDATPNNPIASVPAGNPEIGNTVVSIDPVAGDIGPSPDRSPADALVSSECVPRSLAH